MDTAKLLADWYAENVADQLLATVYRDGVVLYANVHPDTATDLEDSLKQSILLTVANSAASGDGMTSCWLLTVDPSVVPREVDWVGVALHATRLAVEAAAPHLLEARRTLRYVDNTDKDANTARAFAELIRDTRP